MSNNNAAYSGESPQMPVRKVEFQMVNERKGSDNKGINQQSSKSNNKEPKTLKFSVKKKKSQRAESLTKKSTSFTSFSADTKNPEMVPSSSATEQFSPKSVDLYQVSREGDVETMERLLQSLNLTVKEQLDKKDNEGFTPLHYAVIFKRVEMCKLLLDNKADVNARDMEDRTPLHLLINKLEDFEPNSNLETTGEEDRPISDPSISEILKDLLLVRDVVVNSKDKNDFTPLHYTSIWDNAECAELLIENNKESILARDKQQMTPLHIAVIYGHQEVARILIKKGDDTRGKDDITKTPRLARKQFRARKAAAVKDHCRENKQLNMQDANGFTPLHYAVMNSNLDMCKLLLNGGADINSRDEYDRTTLHLLVNENLAGWATSGDSNCEILQYLLDQGAKIDAKDCDDCIPLHYASLRGYLACAKLLIEKDDKPIAARDKQEMTPLHLAALHGHVDVAQELIDKKADIGCKDDNNATPLHLASADGNDEMVELLLRNYAKRHNDRCVDILDEKDNDGNTPIHLAVDNGHFQTTKYIVDFCLSKDVGLPKTVNAQRNTKETALHLAARRGYLKIAEYLIQNGAKLDKRDESLSTPLILASSFNRFKVAELLLDNKAKPDLVNSNNLTALWIAAKKGHEKTIEVLLKKQVLANTKKRRSRLSTTPLHGAASGGYLDVVKKLLAAGAQTDAKNENKQTPLHLAAQNGHCEVVKELGEKNRKMVSYGDKNKDTPLHLAAQCGKTECVKELVRLEARVGARNENQYTPLDCCAFAGMYESASVLLEAGCPADPKDKRNITPLHLACEGGHAKMVHLLLKWRADVAHCSNDGRNALDFAIDSGSISCAKVILEDKHWREALMNGTINEISGEVLTPMRKLIKKMPEIAEQVFKKCMNENHEPMNDTKYEILFDYEFLDDEFSCTNWLKMSEQKEDGSYFAKFRALPKQLLNGKSENEKQKRGKNMDHENQSDDETSDDEVSEKIAENHDSASSVYDDKGFIPSGADPYTHSSNLLKKNHPLNIMVTEKHQNLMRHPLVISLLNHKWKTYGRVVYYLNLLLYIFFMGIFNSYMLTMPPPFSIDDGNVTQSCVAIIPEAQPLYGPCYDYYSWGFIAKPLVLLFSVISLLKEVYQLFSQITSYFTSFTNFAEVSLYLLAILTVYSDTSSAGSNYFGVREDWQWQVGAICIFLSWMVLIMFLRNLPRFGMYVLMFNDVLRTFMSFFFVFVLFIFGFALSFHCLLQNQYAFRQWWVAVIKTSIMMIGEIQFEDIFLSEVEAIETGADNYTLTVTAVNYRAVSYALFVLFLIVMSIIIMNLLVGLAVDNIKAVQENAELSSLAMQVKLTLDVEYTLPQFVRRLVMRKYRSFFPNRYRNRSILIKWLFSEENLNLQAIEKALNPEKNDRDKQFELLERRLLTLETGCHYSKHVKQD